MNINTAEFYDEYWGSDASTSYLRDRQLDEIAQYIVQRIGGTPCKVVDLGGGVSRVARLAKQAGHFPHVVDFSQSALDMMRAVGIPGTLYDLRKWQSKILAPADVVVCTEVLEHIDEPFRVIAMAAAHAPRAIFTVPDNCMGPDECATHLRKYDTGLLRKQLSLYWSDVYIKPMYRWLIAEVASPCSL